MSFTLDEMREGTAGRVLLAERREFPGGAIDSRTLDPGEVFFALVGTKSDGHNYLENALAQGAGGAVIAEEKTTPELLHKLRRFGGVSLVCVDDPEQALSRLGGFVRSLRAELQAVAITGSNGKTTTKEILSTVLADEGPTLKTQGNLNNQLGVPLTLLCLAPEHRFAVVEIGASAPGEVDALARMVRPRVGILTNIAPAHLEGFGSLEGVRRSKGELLRHVAVSGTIVVNADDPGALSLADEFGGKCLRFSLEKEGGDVWVSDLEPSSLDGVSFVIHAGGKVEPVRLPLVGEHNVANALAATAAALALGLPLSRIVKSLERVRPAPLRSEVRVGSDGTILYVDCYNANPASMSRALQALVGLPGKGRKIAILGQMNELGAQSELFHQALGEEAARQGIDWLLYTGAWADEVVKAAQEHGLERAESFPSHEEILSALSRGLKSGDRILIKGSRGARMERVAQPLLRRVGADRSGEAAEERG